MEEGNTRVTSFHCDPDTLRQVVRASKPCAVAGCPLATQWIMKDPGDSPGLGAILKIPILSVPPFRSMRMAGTLCGFRYRSSQPVASQLQIGENRRIRTPHWSLCRMNLHEYQAKQILARTGVPVPAGAVAHTPEAAEAVAKKLGGILWVVKAQIHAGGRGKAGGVRLCRSLAEVRQAALAMIGHRLVTHQSGPEGLPVSAVLVESGSAIAHELYLSLVVDRPRECLSFIASPEGGVEIETVAQAHPDQIVTVPLIPGSFGVPGYVTRILAGRLNLSRDLYPSFEKLIAGLYDCLLATDASLIEINPLIVTATGDLVALDAKITLDDNALFRHPDLAVLDDPSQRNPAEEEAERAGLNYVALDGDIACMVNGAGLAMATMDLIQLQGGKPANFLDVGGDATAGRVTQAFHIFRSNANVRAVFVNIFGGIVRCDLIAEGLITAMREATPKVPVIVRLEGTRAEEGRALLSESGLPIQAIAGLAEAAGRAVQAAGEVS